MRATPEWVHAYCMYLYGIIDDEPGIWTARLCRMVNGVSQDEQGIIYCGSCAHYANPRKRARAVYWAGIPTLPGLEPPFQLHSPCSFLTLYQIQGYLRKLRNNMFMVSSNKEKIPDVRQARGWDWATRWYP